MSCEQWEVRIAEALDGAMPDEVRSHVNQCARCAALLAELEANSEALRGMDDVPDFAVAQLHHRVMNAIPQSSSRRVITPVRARWLAAAAAVVIIVAGSLWRPDALVPVDPPSVPVARTPQVALPTPAVERPVAVIRKSTPVPAAKPRRAQPARSMATSTTAREDARVPRLVVKLVTDDPNVVIYLQSDEKKEGAL
ncbi:MAG: hypothetical protein JNL98_22700 [Bryobacterales bacterium]|nr:hypothetical protein [Bryobacterales bacterium]